MKMTREKLYQVNQALSGLAPQVKGVRLSYTISWNLIALKPEVESIDKAAGPEDAFKEYLRERRAALARIAAKDEDGQPRTSGPNYLILDPNAEEAELAKVKEKYKAAIDRHQEREPEIEKFMNEEVDIELKTFTIEELEDPKAVVPDAPGLAPFIIPLIEAKILE